MAMYYGLKAIAARMGCSSNALMTSLYERHRFLMYRRWLVLPSSRKPRLVWITNDELITRWELAQCPAQYAARPPRPRKALDRASRTSAESGPMHGPRPAQAPRRARPASVEPAGELAERLPSVVSDAPSAQDQGSASDEDRNAHA